MKRIAKVAAVGTAGLGLILGATPAHAHGTGVVAFVGSATVTPALGAPVIGTPQNGGWSLSNAGALPNIGVGAATTGAAGAAVINVAGSLGAGLVAPFGNGALCGLSGGDAGVGTIEIAGDVVDVHSVGWDQSAATIIVFDGKATDGDGSEGDLIGAVSAIPPVPGVIGAGSCAGGTATQFTVVGAGIANF